MGQVGEVDRPRQLVEKWLAGRLGEHAVDHTEDVVAGGAGAGPRRRQLLAGLEDLLDQDVRRAGERGEPVEVRTGVAQPVGVIDAQPVDQTDVEPPLDLGMRRVEHLGLLDADPGQRGHREEPSVVELGVAAPPRGQLVVLFVEGRGRRRHRQPELVVAHLARVGVHLDRAFVVVAHDRHEEPAGTGVPVDVEVRREAGRGSVLEDVPPPGGRPGRGDPDVVGHDVDQHAHAQRARRRGQHVQPGRPPALGVLARVHGDVVPVLAASLRGQQGREVDPVDTEVVEVRQPLRRLEQVELRGELEPVGAPWRAGGHGRGSTPVSHVRRWPRPRTRPPRRRPSGRARRSAG